MAHHPGKFVWFELNAKDIARAKTFYGELFGWKVNGAPMGGGEYQMISNGETSIGGLVALTSDHPHWASYLSVEDVDRAVDNAVKGGGRSIKPAFDVPSVGRMALISDPQGARLLVFRSQSEDAADRDTKHGDWFWNELWTSDAAKATAFYEKAFGFSSEAMSMGEMKYYVLKAENASRGGVMTSPVSNIPTNWLPYVRVDRVDEVVKRAQKLGGSVMSEPQEIPNIGRYAILKDAEGAAIAVITPSTPR